MQFLLSRDGFELSCLQHGHRHVRLATGKQDAVAPQGQDTAHRRYTAVQAAAQESWKKEL
jgi:hypothetical protein